MYLPSFFVSGDNKGGGGDNLDFKNFVCRHHPALVLINFSIPKLRPSFAPIAQDPICAGGNAAFASKGTGYRVASIDWTE
jgi:hypothetical protein